MRTWIAHRHPSFSRCQRASSSCFYVPPHFCLCSFALARFSRVLSTYAVLPQVLSLAWGVRCLRAVFSFLRNFSKVAHKAGWDEDSAHGHAFSLPQRFSISATALLHTQKMYTPFCKPLLSFSFTDSRPLRNGYFSAIFCLPLIH